MDKGLISYLIEKGYLKSPEIIGAFKKIDRADFLPSDFRDQAAKNIPLPIGYGQTISQPLTVAFMLELLMPEKGDKILEIGSGSAWQTALLASLVGEKGRVLAIERIRELKEFGKNNISKYNYIEKGRVKFIAGDGSRGLKEFAPFDKIIAAASSGKIFENWKKQLKAGGRMVVPIRESIWLLIKEAENSFKTYKYPGFTFVPLINENS